MCESSMDGFYITICWKTVWPTERWADRLTWPLSLWPHLLWSSDLWAGQWGDSLGSLSVLQSSVCCYQSPWSGPAICRTVASLLLTISHDTSFSDQVLIVHVHIKMFVLPVETFFECHMLTSSIPMTNEKYTRSGKNINVSHQQIHLNRSCDD